MTGSSGGGFALMVEALGLAGCSETPLVILESQRPGPSTGLPTRTEQGALSFVLAAGQGDFPRAVLAPGTPAQGFALTARAFNLADRYQLPVLVITDQYFGDTSFTHETGDFPATVEIERAIDTGPAQGVYERYALTASGVSPRRLPGFGPVVAADSDEHTPDGHLTEHLAVLGVISNIASVPRMAALTAWLSPSNSTSIRASRTWSILQDSNCACCSTSVSRCDRL